MSVLLARVRDDGDVDCVRAACTSVTPPRLVASPGRCAPTTPMPTTSPPRSSPASSRRCAAGNGPTELALPYLFASIKHRHWRTAGRRAHETALACTAPVDSAARDANDIVEAEVVRTALATLPADVQVLLWRTEVDDESVDDAAERHGTSAHNLAVHRHRARRALGTAYLAQHVEPDGGPGDLDPECQATLAHLASLVRNKIGVRRRRQAREAPRRLPALLPDTRAPRAHQHPPARPSDAAVERLGGRTETTIKAQVSTWIGTSAVTLAGSSALAVAMLAPAPAMPGPPTDTRASVVAHTPFEPHGAAARDTGAGTVGRVDLTAAASGPPAGSGNRFEVPPSPGQPMAPATSEPGRAPDPHRDDVGAVADGHPDERGGGRRPGHGRRHCRPRCRRRGHCRPGFQPPARRRGGGRRRP